ncbi:major facilitator superfamily domain-containing protein [Truncatella angustata]|uniref:Major facilitator superfamily domain-containing protein n=1 Tax=Truncatella angustata TaxID=152316 RepID=A0A9P8UHD7_9PEZI|nr:major facilitator superfamily domain-containing protein [Truncatella angustata]KAH6652225.1 major facilitator superfamily domain-containing protein [Truncatella angustata]
MVIGQGVAQHSGSIGGREDIEILKLDKHGLPLIPQPTSRKDDPLNWSPPLKALVLLQVSWLAFLGPLGAAIVNPAFLLLSKEFNISVVQVSYELTVYIIAAGVGPLLTLPLANIYGRRPVYVLGTLVAAATNIAAGYCKSWSGLMVTRVFNGIASGSPIAIGPATVCDLYYSHERGFYMGIYTLFLTNGAHVAPLIGGFVSQSLGWRWAFLIPGYVQLATLVFTLLCLPETLYSRQPVSTDSESSFADLLLFKNMEFQNTKLHWSDFLRPFYMLKYIPIVIPGLYYMTAFGFGSVLFATTGAHIFSELYHFNVAQTGLILSIPLFIGCLLGEMCAGWVTDYMVYRHAKAHGGRREPEPRINALVLAVLCPIGIIIDGVCLSHHSTISWIGPAVGMGLANFGMQIATTVTYTYCTDCYRPQSSEVSSILNVFRHIFSMTTSFYAIPLGESIGYQYAWLIFALINVVFLIMMVLLRLNGSRWRNSAWQKPPTFHNDI